MSHDSLSPVYAQTMKAAEISEIRRAISSPRISTYDAAIPGDAASALALYTWNAQISAAFMLPLHFVEVLTRNAAAEGIETVYGARWPWSHGFEQSLQSPPPKSHSYNPRRDLTSTRSGRPTAGKVIPEVKFVFWQKMFTARYDQRLWDQQILSLFPNASGSAPSDVRQKIYDHLEHIRNFRNRVAHHEPIFSRNLNDDLTAITDLISMRSPAAGTWLSDRELVTGLLLERPIAGANHATA